jgi:hypothetical protein
MNAEEAKNHSVDFRRRRRAYENDAYAWHHGKLPASLRVGDIEITPHPASNTVVFVVHGIGSQTYSETAATLRSGFEDALVRIREWQEKQIRRGVKTPTAGGEYIPPPYIREGFWADYPDVDTTFPEDIDKLSAGARSFFRLLWRQRILSNFRTYGWFLQQQLKLLHPRTLMTRPLAYAFYWLLQPMSFLILTLCMLRFKPVITDFLADVRMYVDPRGVTERAIVQRIDYRVGRAFLKTIGLDWDFRFLKEKDQLISAGQPANFERVIWVAHSLGTVISYNVLSDLFHRADELWGDGPDAGGQLTEPQLGVRHFRTVLKKFITMGSPLDKIAFLFGERALSPWPERPHADLLKTSDVDTGKEGWWVNFYHFLDPVSGSLESELICRDDSPRNHHIGLCHLPGVSHTAYWKDDKPLRFILGRTYGAQALPDRPFNTKPRSVHTLFAIATHLSAWLFTLLAVLLVLWLCEVDWADNVVQFLITRLSGV